MDWQWRVGRASNYGGAGDPWTIHAGSCSYQYLDPSVNKGWDVAALADAVSDYAGSCGRCYEVGCQPMHLTDGYGAGLDRTDVCYDSNQTVTLMITDTCPCNYPPNYYSNKRWCCGDYYHFDISSWTFEKLAERKYGVIGIRYREVPCDYCPDNEAQLPAGQSPSAPVQAPPSGWSSSQDKRPAAKMCAQGPSNNQQQSSPSPGGNSAPQPGSFTNLAGLFGGSSFLSTFQDISYNLRNSWTVKGPDGQNSYCGVLDGWVPDRHSNIYRWEIERLEPWELAHGALPAALAYYIADADEPAAVRLAAWLLYLRSRCRQQHGSDIWLSWLHLLPQPHSITSPGGWTRQELQQLQVEPLQAVFDVDDAALKTCAAAAFAAFPQQVPGVQLADAGGCYVIKASRPVTAGAELTISYSPPSGITSLDYLTSWGFTCGCQPLDLALPLHEAQMVVMVVQIDRQLLMLLLLMTASASSGLAEDGSVSSGAASASIATQEADLSIWTGGNGYGSNRRACAAVKRASAAPALWPVMGQCCTQFGVCQPDDSKYCAEVPTCQPDISSSTSRACRANIAGLKRRVRRYKLIATEGTRAPDGYPRTVILLNGQFPGPTLTAEVGDRIIITFTNHMNSSASIHMHGMLQRTSNTQDGAVPITQRDVLPGGTFVYNYIADAPGTYWYHSHYLTQYTDGLKGNLLITDPTARKYAAEPVLEVSDWYHVNSSTVVKDAMYNHVFLKANSTLINGVGQSSSCGKSCKYAMVRGFASSCDNPRMRMRIINSGGGSIFNVSIDDHRMIVVAADGVSYKGFEVGSLQINAGQRYDVLVCSRKPSSYLSRKPVWIRAGIQDFTTVDTFSLAVLYFTQQAPASLPTSQAVYEGPALTIGDVSDAVNPNTLQPAVVPPPATRTVRYTISFFGEYLNGVNGLYGHLNNISLQMSPFAPSLLERYSNNPEGLPAPEPINSGLGWHIIHIKEGDVIDVILDNEDAGEHPMHLHGHWFWVIGFGKPFEGPYRGQELHPSVIRDTATIANKSWLAIRFIADNPGAWILHCHIDKHLAMGMGIIFQETVGAT
eukprot:gene5109-5349_t